MRLLVCGSRNWHDIAPIQLYLKRAVTEAGGPKKVVLIHGAAPGADTAAAYVGRQLGLRVIGEPADWKQYGKGAGPIRNQKMLDVHKPDRVVAFRTSGKSSGTDDIINRARNAGVPVTVVSD